MLSFDITDRNIRIIKGTENNGKIRVSSAATLSLEESVIVNGHAKDVPRLATLINQVLKTNKMSDKDAIVSISSNLTVFKELTVPKVKEQEFPKVVRAEMQAAVGIDDSYSISYVIVGGENADIKKKGKTTDSKTAELSSSDTVKVLATSCPNEVVDCYRKVFQMLGITLRSVIVGCNCITKVLLADPKSKAKMPMLAVQIDNNFISLNLYEDSQLSFSRFASIDPADYDNSDDYVFEAVNENIFRMLQFQRGRNPQNPIGNIVFYGDTSDYDRLADAFDDMETEVIKVPPQIHGQENVEFSVYANAIGAMFQRNKNTEKINLLESGGAAAIINDKLSSDNSFKYMLIGSIAIPVVVMGIISGVFIAKDSSIQGKIEDAQATIDSPETHEIEETYNNRVAMLESVHNYTNMAKLASLAYDTLPTVESSTYETIEETVYAAGDEAGVEDVVFSDVEYSSGQLTFTVTAVTWESFSQQFPAKAVEKLSELDIVEFAEYVGYDVEMVILSDGNGGVIDTPVDEPEEPDEGMIENDEEVPVAAAANGEETISQVEFTLVVTLKGGNPDLSEYDTENVSEESETAEEGSVE